MDAEYCAVTPRFAAYAKLRHCSWDNLVGQASPFLIFSLVGGGVADRVDKRRLLLVTQSLQIVFAFVLGILTVTGLVQFWHIVVLSMLVGVTLSFDQPTRFALIPSLVPREDLSNAISLNTILFNGAAIVGSALGGVLVMVIGYAGVFFVNGLSYVAVIVALLLMRPSPIVSSRSGSLFRAIRGGLTHIFHDRFLATLLINFGSLLFFGSTYTILLALFAKTELRTTPVGLGVLYTAIGIGPIVGSLAVASLGDFRCKGRLLMVLSISMSLSEIASSLLHVYWLSLSLLLVAGAAQAVTSAVSITLMQLNTASQYDGPRDEHQHLRYYGNSTAGCIPHWCFERSYRCFCRNSFWRSDSVCDMRLSIRG